MVTDWRNEILDEREQRVEKAAENYMSDPCGLPGHNLLVIIAKQAKLLDEYQSGKRGTTPYEPA
jgi:hypothetical protein